MTYSDKNGLYVFKNVKAQNIHNHMTISKDGYIAACKTFRVQKESRLIFKSVLTPMVFAHRISSSAGGVVKNNQVTLSFEPHSFVFDQDKSVGTYVYKGLYAGLGIDYSHSKELFISKSESLTKMIINFDPNTGKAIDTTFVNGTLIQKGEINYKSIDIPLVLGFQKSIHKWNLGLECTDGLNIVLEATGKTFNRHLIVSRIESEKDMYKEKLGWSGKINACAAYHINHCTQIIAKPYYLWQMHPISTQNALIKPNGVLLV